MLAKGLRTMVVCLTVLLLVVPLSASGQKVKLRYWCQTQLSHSEMVSSFEAKYPDVSIETTVYEAEQLNLVLRSALAAGTGPDLMYTNLGINRIGPIIDAGLVIDLEEPAKKFGWKERISKFALGEATHRGKLWAIPNEAECIVMYYNKKIFQKIGVTVPTTWAELITLCKKCGTAGFDPVAFGVAQKRAAHHRVGLAYQWGGGVDAVRKCIFEGDPLDAPQFVEGVRILLELDKNYMPNALDRTEQEAYSFFIGGDAAMCHTGTWFNEFLLKDAPNPDDFDMFLPLPRGADKPSSIAGCGSGWYASSESKNLEACLLFLDYCAREEAARLWVKHGFTPTLKKYDISGAKVGGFLSKVVEFMTSYEMGFFLHHFIAPDTDEWLMDGYQKMLAGTVTPKRFCERLEEKAQEARREGFRP